MLFTTMINAIRKIFTQPPKSKLLLATDTLVSEITEQEGYKLVDQQQYDKESDSWRDTITTTQWQKIQKDQYNKHILFEITLPEEWIVKIKNSLLYICNFDNTKDEITLVFIDLILNIGFKFIPSDDTNVFNQLISCPCKKYDDLEEYNQKINNLITSFNNLRCAASIKPDRLPLAKKMYPVFKHLKYVESTVYHGEPGSIKKEVENALTQDILEFILHSLFLFTDIDDKINTQYQVKELWEFLGYKNIGDMCDRSIICHDDLNIIGFGNNIQETLYNDIMQNSNTPQHIRKFYYPLYDQIIKSAHRPFEDAVELERIVDKRSSQK